MFKHLYTKQSTEFNHNFQRLLSNGSVYPQFTHILIDPRYQPGPTCGCKHLVETQSSPKDKSHWVLSLNSGPMFPLRCRCNFLAWLLWLLHTGGKLICYQRIVIKFTANTSVVLLELWYVMRGKCTAYIIGHCHYSMLSLIVFKWSYSSGIKIVAHRNTKFIMSKEKN